VAGRSAVQMANHVQVAGEEEEQGEGQQDEIEVLLSSFKAPYFTVKEEKQSAVDEDLDHTEDLTQQSQFRISKTLLETPLPSLENLGISKSALELIRPTMVSQDSDARSSDDVFDMDFIQEVSPNFAIAPQAQPVQMCKILKSQYEKLPSYLRNMATNEEINQILDHAFKQARMEGSNRWINSNWFNSNYPTSKCTSSTKLFINNEFRSQNAPSDFFRW
jgi:hypothetical protein